MKCFFILAVILSTVRLSSQSIDRQVFASSGLSAPMMEYTIGEVFTSTLSNDANIISQGFHQTDLIYISVDEKDSYNIGIFPNPTRQNFSLNYFNIAGNISVEIFNLQSELVRIFPVIMNGELISIEPFAAGTYIVRTRDSNGSLISHHRLVKL